MKGHLTKSYIWYFLVQLAMGTGRYGELCQRIAEGGEDYLQELEDMHFNTVFELINYLETA